MSPAQIILEVGRHGGSFKVDNESFRIEAAKGTLPKELVDVIRQRKDEMLEFLLRTGVTPLHTTTPISKAAEKELYDLSSAQRRIYFLQQVDADSTSYSIPSVSYLGHNVNPEKIQGAFEQLIARHENLRTTFLVVDGKPFQKINEHVDFSLECKHATNDNLPTAYGEFFRPFDLHNDVLIRACLVFLPANDVILLTDVHHIISDGVSDGILKRDFNSIMEGVSLPPVRYQYRDFSEWHNELVKSPAIVKQEQYWLQKLRDDIPRLDFMQDFPRPETFTNEGGIVGKLFSKEISDNVNQIGARNKGTLFMTMLALLNTLFYKYTGNEHIIIGCNVAGRSHPDVQNIAGIMVNTLPIGNRPWAGQTFSEFLDDVIKNSINALENQDVQFEQLVEKLKVERDPSRHPVFDILLTVQNYDHSPVIDRINSIDQPFEVSRYEGVSAKFDLDITVEDVQGQVYVSIEYYSGICERTTVHRILSHLEKVIEVVTSNPEVKLGEIDILSEHERDKILHQFNKPISYVTHETFVDLFEAQASETPMRVAASHAGNHVSYLELNQRSNQLAKLLQNCGAGKDVIVGVLVERSIDHLHAIVSVLKSGAAYLPIDVSLPDERIISILQDCASRIVLFRSSNAEQAKRILGQCDALNAGICIDAVLGYGQPVTKAVYDLSAIQKFSTDDLEIKPSPNDLAYIIFTSGSTGRPKGVMITHDGMLNHFRVMIEELELFADSVLLQSAPISFDISVWQFLTPLCNGGKVVIYGNDVILDPPLYVRKVGYDEITHIQVVPSYLNVLLNGDMILGERWPKLRYLIVTGETVNKELVAETRKKLPSVKIVNAYGPAEAADDATLYIIGDTLPANSIPVGHPLDNFNVYVINHNDQLCPIGVVGEIAIAGIGLGRGYLNAPELTHKKFGTGLPGIEHRVYRTGDMGYWLSDGNIAFSGRTDRQVKIRGQRLELDEIEANLAQFPPVDHCAVIARENGKNGKMLVAHYVQNAEVTTDQIVSFLRSRLPEYMIPSVFVQSESLPLTANGKINYNLLKDVEPHASANDFQPPANETERILVAIWAELLNIEQTTISTTDSFFALGGHSLLATQLIFRISKKLGVKIPIVDLFKYTTVGLLAARVRSLAHETSSNLDDHIVPLNSGKAGVPVFLLPGSLGIAQGYEFIGKAMEPYAPVYGLDMMGINEGQTPFDKLSHMVEFDLQLIKIVQPQGPYRFIAHSFGGHIVHEVVKVLESRGEEVSWVVIMDVATELHSVAEKSKADIVDFLTSTLLYIFDKNDADQRSLMSWKDDLESMFQQCQSSQLIPSLRRYLAEKLGGRDFYLRLLDVVIANDITNKVSGMIKSPVIVAKAEDNPALSDTSGWQASAADTRIISLPGDHLTMVRKAGADKLVTQLAHFGFI